MEQQNWLIGSAVNYRNSRWLDLDHVVSCFHRV